MTETTAGSKAARLAEVYEQIPSTNCQGLCADSCCSMGQTRVEQVNIRAATGVMLPLAHAGARCAALTMLNRCGVYDVRPAVCRLWGTTRSMRCNFGCVPEGGFLSDAQAYELLARVAEIDGDPGQAEAFRAPFRDPDTAAAYMRALTRAQRERDLDFEERAARPGAVFVLGAGRISSSRPGGGGRA